MNSSYRRVWKNYLSISLNHHQFINVLQFSVYRSFTFLDKFIPIFFFWCDFKSGCFTSWYYIISVKKCNSFLYINLVSCYLAEFISSNSFGVETLRFFIESIVAPSKSDSFTSCLPLCILFFLLSDCCG